MLSEKKMKSFCLGFVAGLFFMWSAFPTFLSGLIVGVVLVLAYPSFGNDFCNMAYKISYYLTDVKSETTSDTVYQQDSPSMCTETDSILSKDKLQ